MTIESELKNWLAENLSEEKKWVQEAHIERDRKIILEYYGFGASAYPTYEQIGEVFSAGTRQNVERLISKKFAELADIGQFKGLRSFSEFIMQTEFLPVIDLRDWLEENGLGTSSSSLRGLLRLAEEMGGVSDRVIYSPTLERVAGRERLNDENAFFIVSPAEKKRLAKRWRAARNGPGRHGLCRIGWIKETADNEKDAEKVILLIRSHPDTLVVEDREESWYCIEGCENKLFNDCRKVFGLVERCEFEELSANLRNSMNARTAVIEYPPVEVIQDWIRGSKFFSRKGETVTFLGDTADLTESEALAVQFLKDRGPSLFATMRDYLMANGMGSPAATKVINNSPFISIDRSGGKKKFLFRLIGDGESRNWPKNDEGERYLQFKRRLEIFLETGTDTEATATKRKEQEILKKWLFDEKNESGCALCGRIFSVEALRAAHKKKRADCTEEERVDPFIVFPVCVFGCDYLYEERYLQVVDGKLKASKSANVGTVEYERIKELEGRIIPEQWLKGPELYFE